MTTLPKYLTQDELKRFFATIKSPRDKALFGLIYHYGLRVGEALMLTVDDVNFTTHRITIRRLKHGLGGEKPLWRHTAKLLVLYEFSMCVCVALKIARKQINEVCRFAGSNFAFT
jgi:integrase